MSCFLQQRLAELLGLVIGKSQALASLNMTVLVHLVILYRASFSFARGAGKNSLIIINLRVKKCFISVQMHTVGKTPVVSFTSIFRQQPYTVS
jgi:hypothetical protein